MAKNYMPEIAKMLGVDERGLEFKGTAGWCLSERIEWLLTGRNEILKLPWQPKEGDRYYFPATDFQYSCPETWDNHPIDFALKEAGMAFKTKEECEAALPELRKKYLSETGADR